MKAIRVREFGGPDKLQLEECEDLHPGPGEVLVRIHAAGVNPVDTYIRSGAYARKPNLPYTPGSDGAGVVIAVGEKVERFQKGDRIYVAGSVTGTYAEQAICRESQIHRLPENVTYLQGAAVGVPYCTAYRALFQKAKARPVESILIHGASGGVGIAAVQLARSWGMNVIGTGGTDRGRALIKEHGAHHDLDHTAAEMPEQVMKITGGRGVDIILEMLANKNLGHDLSMLAQNGRVVVIGNRGTIEINPRDAMSREAMIIGMILFNTPEREMAEIHAALGAALESGVARPVIGRELPLSNAAQAHEIAMQPGSYGKIVLVPI
ncbi:NADPH:quinone reductase [bacterium]|nr:NADPH:quinone reductase [bacterium]